LPPSKTWMLV